MHAEGSHIHALATEAGSYFKTATRLDESTYVKAEGAPQWVAAMIRTAHGQMLPDDYKYATIREALECIAEESEATGGDDIDWSDIGWEFAARTDDYAGELCAWLASHSDRPAFCDEWVEEFGGGHEGILDRIGHGQSMERCEIFDYVVSALYERKAWQS